MKLTTLTDVDAMGALAGQVLAKDEPSDQWKPRTIVGTQVFADEAGRLLAVPERLGQIGIQVDDGTIWYADGTAAGDWTQPVAAPPDPGGESE